MAFTFAFATSAPLLRQHQHQHNTSNHSVASGWQNFFLPQHKQAGKQTGICDCLAVCVYIGGFTCIYVRVYAYKSLVNYTPCCLSFRLCSLAFCGTHTSTHLQKALSRRFLISLHRLVAKHVRVCVALFLLYNIVLFARRLWLATCQRGSPLFRF